MDPCLLMSFSIGFGNGLQTTVKSPSKVPETNLSDVFTLYYKWIWGVLTVNHTSIDGCISNWGLMQIGYITDVLEMYWAGNCRVLIMYWQMSTSQYIIDVFIYVVRCIMMYSQMYCSVLDEVFWFLNNVLIHLNTL